MPQLSSEKDLKELYKMEVLTELFAENGILMGVSALFGAVLGHMFALSKIRKANAETEAIKKEMVRKEKDWLSKQKPVFSKSLRIEPAKKNIENGTHELLDDSSYFTINIDVSNNSSEVITIEEARFLAEERYVDNSYGNENLKKINKEITGGIELDVKANEKTTMSYKFKIGRTWHSRLNGYALITARIGNNDPVTVKFGENDCHYIY